MNEWMNLWINELTNETAFSFMMAYDGLIVFKDTLMNEWMNE